MNILYSCFYLVIVDLYDYELKCSMDMFNEMQLASDKPQVLKTFLSLDVFLKQSLHILRRSR